MATYERDVLMQHKDEDGNTSIIYPATTMDNVLGLDDHINDSDIHFTMDAVGDYVTYSVGRRLSAVEQRIEDVVSAAGIESSQFSANNGHVWFSSGLLIQWGNPSCAATANAVTTTRVNYPLEFESYAPRVLLTPHISVPQNVSVGTGGGTTTGVDIYLYRNTASSCTVTWVAIGYAAP